MAYTKKEEKARLEGMLFALKIAEESGLEALRTDIKKRGAYNIPIPVTMSVVNEFSNNVKNQTCDTFLTLSLVTLHDEFGFGHKRLQKFMDRFELKASCFDGDFTTWQEQLDILNEECDI